MKQATFTYPVTILVRVKQDSTMEKHALPLLKEFVEDIKGYGIGGCAVEAGRYDVEIIKAKLGGAMKR